MFTAEEIYKRVKQLPFVPLRIRTKEGEQHDVLHPELILFSKSWLYVGTPSKDNPAIYDQMDRVYVPYITAVEDLPASHAAVKSGQ